MKEEGTDSVQWILLDTILIDWMVVLLVIVCISTVFRHRVTLQWERWWMQRLAPSQRWRSTSQHYCRAIVLAPNVMRRLLKQHSQGPCLGVSCLYLWVHKKVKWRYCVAMLSVKFPCTNLCLCVSTAQGICMIIGGIKHREQRFNSRSAGVSSALLFISVGGVYGSWTCNTFSNNMCPTNRFTKLFKYCL